jgi:hypothetical protein
MLKLKASRCRTRVDEVMFGPRSQRLVNESTETTLRLIDTTTTSTGVVVLTTRRSRTPLEADRGSDVMGRAGIEPATLGLKVAAEGSRAFA